MPLHRLFHYGSFAEQMLVPTQKLTRIGEIDAADATGGQLSAGWSCRAAGCRRGAGKVVATGRNMRTLDDLVRGFLLFKKAYVASYNLHHRPFAWTATADSILAKLQLLCKLINGTAH